MRAADGARVARGGLLLALLCCVAPAARQVREDGQVSQAEPSGRVARGGQDAQALQVARLVAGGTGGAAAEGAAAPREPRRGDDPGDRGLLQVVDLAASSWTRNSKRADPAPRVERPWADAAGEESSRAAASGNLTDSAGPPSGTPAAAGSEPADRFVRLPFDARHVRWATRFTTQAGAGAAASEGGDRAFAGSGSASDSGGESQAPTPPDAAARGATYRLYLDWRPASDGLLFEVVLDGERLPPPRDGWRPSPRQLLSDLGPRWLGRGEHLLEFVAREQPDGEGALHLGRLELREP